MSSPIISSSNVIPTQSIQAYFEKEYFEQILFSKEDMPPSAHCFAMIQCNLRLIPTLYIYAPSDKTSIREIKRCIVEKYPNQFILDKIKIYAAGKIMKDDVTLTSTEVLDKYSKIITAFITN